MRVVLFTGKGGVGKTTVAAATAVHAARCGLKAVVLSTDAAHSLADVLGVELSAQPRELESGLSAAHVDPKARGRQAWRSIQEYAFALLDTLGVDPIVAEELTVLPGAEEVLALLDVRDQVQSGLWDLVVVDCAPTAETLRLLALPEALSRYLEQALPMERRVMRALAGARLGQLGQLARGARPQPVPRDHVVEAAERLHLELAGVREVLTDPNTCVRIVLTCEDVVIAEARRAWTTLSLFGYRVDAVVANRLVPGGGDRWRQGWARAQAERLEAVRASFAPVPVHELGYAASEPVGVEALAEIGRDLYGTPGSRSAQALLHRPVAPEPLRVGRDGDQFVLSLRLPLARRGEVDLARVGDDLVITAGAHRRVLTLPSALRRCLVVGARLRDGSLEVRFEPDPQLWRPL